MSCYKAVCFDLFDTLITFNEQKYDDLHRESVSRKGLNPEKFMAAWKATGPDALNGLIMTVSERYQTVLAKMELPAEVQEIVPDLLKAEATAVRTATKPVPGVREFLIHLLRRKKRLGLISNASCIGPLILQQLNWQHYFDEQVFSFAEKLWKPDPEIYLLACDRLGFPPQYVAFVSDGDGGELTGAADAHLDTIRFDPWNRYPDQPLPPGCFDCKNLTDLQMRLMI